MAKDAAIKGGGEVEALEYGLSLRGKGYGEEVEILADIIEYGESNPDSEVNALLSEFAEEASVDKTSRNGIMEEGLLLSDLGKFKKKMRKDRRIEKKYYSVLKKRFSQGNDVAKAVFNKYVPVDSVENSSFEGNARYDAKGTQKIRMHYGADINNSRGSGATYFHEHGHMIDSLAGNVSQSKKFLFLLQSDLKNHISNYATEKKISSRSLVIKNLVRELNDMRKHSGVADIYNGLTVGEVKAVASHKDEYWKIKGKIEREAFAHMFEAQFDAVRYAEMKKYFPQALAWFENKLKEMLQ